MPSTLRKLRDQKVRELFAAAKVKLANARLLELHGPSVVAKMERQEARQVMRQINQLPVIHRLPR